jgi:ADP-heptose:LPS heptosyltransferase
MFVEQGHNVLTLGQPSCAPHELEYIAFSGQRETAHGIFRSLPKHQWHVYANKYTLTEVIQGGIRKLDKFLSASAEKAAGDEKQFVDDLVRLFIATCRHKNVYPRELYLALLEWCEKLTKLSLLAESLGYYDEVISLGVNTFPDLSARAILGKSSVLNTLGRFAEAQQLLGSLSCRPYVISDRNLIPQLFFILGRESLLQGDANYYKQLLFQGLRQFYTNIEQRASFVDQLRKTYRRSYRLLLDPSVSISDKLLFATHWLYFRVHTNRLVRLTRLQGLLKAAVLGYVYVVNYLRREPVFRSVATATVSHSRVIRRNNEKGRTTSSHRNILITRAMGGIGDLLMMTPGFRALKQKYPDEEIHLAIPRRYFPLFENNPDVKVVDIENDELLHRAYKRWHNLTDCPAARVESRTAPKVKKSRIDIFASALGIGWWRLHQMNRKPVYVITQEEREFQKRFWIEHGLSGKTVIAVQLRSDEVYRDYPHMESLVRRLSNRFHVLVFDADPIEGLAGDCIMPIGGLPMRRAFALVAGCDAVIAPDSAFVHLAAALELPCVALYGPIDGKVRTRYYPLCIYLNAKDTLGCLPCWRNDAIPCKLTNMRASVCMTDIGTARVEQTLLHLLTRKTRP